VVDGSALWFGAAGSETLDVVDDDGELVVEVQAVAAVAGCAACGTRAVQRTVGG
jgi:hypothetical protein